MHRLKNLALLQNKLFINNEWVDAKDNTSFKVVNPYDHSIIEEVASAGEHDAERAVAAAHIAFDIWKNYTAGERAAFLKKWHALIIKYKKDLATLLTLEQGKPLAEAMAEINYGASFIEWFAEEARRVYGDVIPAHQSNKRILVLKQPIGVVAAITPWNFPNAMITRKIAPALAVGCTVVIKPAEDTPLSALALAVLTKEAGFPPGVINILPTEDPKEVGAVLTSDTRVKKLSFTGSTKVGKLLMQEAASSLKKLSLELGGNAPFIVFNDADIDQAVAGAISAKYRNAGQTCISANRIFLQADIYYEFMKKYLKQVGDLQTGNGLDGADIGPLINKKALDKIEYLLADAVSKGAEIKCGGTLIAGHAHLFPATILTNIDANMEISKTEVFGPIAPIYKFDDVDEVITMANNTQAGLAAYFYGQNQALIWKVAEELEYGMVGINTGMISTTVAPFGGIKESGFGREGSKYGIEDYVVMKYLCMEV